MRVSAGSWLALGVLLTVPVWGADEVSVTNDLVVPEISADEPAPGKRVVRQLPEYVGSEVHHVLYLPRDWKRGKRYPVIVEYAGNKYGTSLGTVEGSCLGYGLTGGTGAIWVCLPYVNSVEQRNQETWWGDVEATVTYCKTAVADICRDYGGDRERLFLAGFSRGAIACNFIGLHNDDIAGLWRGFICHSHYDGVRAWPYPGSDRESAAVRLRRLGQRPQFISHEGSVAATRDYLNEVYPQGNFTFVSLPGVPHTDTWVLRDSPERQALRDWFQQTVAPTSAE